MTTELIAIQANIIQVLDWYEQPELLLLEGPKHTFTLAVRSAMSEADDVYVGGSMSVKRLRDYANGKCDLRYAIAHANLRKFWRFKLVALDQPVRMTQIKRSDGELLASIPEPGLFAGEHEDIDIAKSYIPNTVEKFDVDGGWDLGEFSQFYSQIEDIYYISSDIDRFDDPKLSADEKNVITGAFERSWDGGGSYVAFYKKVANDNDFHAPLRVSGIKYNSPGYVSIHARAEPFNNLMNILQYFADNESVVKSTASALGRFMSRSGMKANGFSVGMMNAEQKVVLTKLSQALSDHIPSLSFDTLKEMTGGNVLVAAKVLESIFRRVDRLYKFFDQGRVSHPTLNVR